MTYNQLKEDVICLGFERDIEDEDGLLLAANRALQLIYTERPRETRTRLSCHGLGEQLIHSELSHMCGETIKVPLCGKAYSFRVSGRGEYTLTDGSGTHTQEFECECETVKGYIIGSGELVFEGDYFFTVYDLCCYDRRFGDDIALIPEREAYRTIKISEHINDFRAFASLPEDRNGNRIEGASLRGESVILPRDFTGELVLSYFRTPKRITSESADEPIDISEEMSCLLPLLTASFLWLDDDSNKAQYYMALYREALSGILRYSKVQIDTKYCTNGWA